ncbi:MAG: hypothetical protein ACXWC2_22905 [Ramlibacter sp.]
MQFPFFAGALCGLALTLPAAQALGRIGAAEVREGPRGGPCFTIGAREEGEGTPDFHAVTVSDGQRLLWKMSMPPDRTFALSSSMCVPYGGQVASLPHTQAAALEAGKVYYLRIEARSGKARGAAQAYDARFCLVRQRDGGALVRQIPDGERPGKRLFGCLPPAE